MFENNLLSQVNVQSPLPTFVETEVIDNISSSLHRAFLFGHTLLAEKSNIAAIVLPYTSEIYFTLRALLERVMLNHVNTTFVELLFGLRRCAITGPATSYLSHLHTSNHANTNIENNRKVIISFTQQFTWRDWMHYMRWILFGPSPMPTPEEKAMNYINEPHNEHNNYINGQSNRNNNNINNDVKRITDVAPSSESSETTNTTTASEPNVIANTDTKSISDKVSSSSVEGETHAVHENTHSELTAEELHSANETPYGYLRFRPLSRVQKLLSVLLLTLKPYLEMKMMDWYNAQVDDVADAVMMREAYKLHYPHRASLKNFIARYLIPIYHVCNKWCELIYKLCYVFELTPYTSPWHRLCGIVLRRSTMEDQLVPRSRRASRTLLLARVLFMLIFVGFRLLDYSRSGMNRSGTMGGTLGGEDLPVPPPPQWGVDVPEWNESTNVITDVDNHESTNPLSKEKRVVMPVPLPGMCAICKKRVTNAAVCTTSGIVSCYPCLQSYIRQYHVCPVTQKSTTVEQIRRIYEPESITP